jgi:hypothetical protein
LHLSIDIKLYAGSPLQPPNIHAEVALWDSPGGTFRGREKAEIGAEAALQVARAVPLEVAEVGDTQRVTIEQFAAAVLEHHADLAEGQVDRLLGAIATQRAAATELRQAAA